MDATGKPYKIPKWLCALGEFVTMHILSGWGRGACASNQLSGDATAAGLRSALWSRRSVEMQQGLPRGLRSWASELKARWPLEVSEPV